MKSIYKVIFSIILTTTIGLLIITNHNSTAKDSGGKDKPSSNSLSKSMEKIVTTEAVSLAPLTNKVKLTGTVEALPNKQISIPAIVSGRVTAVYASQGDQVKKGQILAKIYSSDMAEVKQEWIEAKANVDRETKEFEVAESLFEAGLSSKLEIQQAKSELEAANAQLDKVNQKLKLMGESNNATHIVRAPISGTVTERNITTNMLLREDFEEALFTVVDLSDVWVKINVFESDIKKVKLGANVKAQAMAYPDEVFEGEIKKISKFIDPETKVMSARVAVNNQHGLLMPNMAMNITVTEDKEENVFAVAENAVVFHNNKEFVVKAKNNEYSILPVTVLGENDHKKVLVRGDLKAQDFVVSEKALLLFNELIQNQDIANN
ncbi:efflux RND transporter periplasmic adaptor subunit [Flammeovirga sp. SubArs3]|uniref:efflux RND transporter periplasmic adaptor subunit n=1 Tax=Flammeovirga sp. SubArs3 TaxID=2995316 RepID=UPI00248C6C35|nr:efflux RND transporter periplasmic adaptor subunit [Flammeovirga sp. SubArs3]